MKIASLVLDGRRQAALLIGGRLVPIPAANEHWGTTFPEDLDGLLQTGQLESLRAKLAADAPPTARGIDSRRATWAPLVERPRNLWGVGLNFRQHAKDLGADTDRRLPTGFHRPTTCLAAHQSTLHIPTTWGTITGEAEIGVLVGKPLQNATPLEARGAIAGYTALLDLTAEQLLRTDTRYIGRAKAFPESVALGPYLVTPDEWEPAPATRIATHAAPDSTREGTLAGMTWDPWTLLSDFSHVFPWFPGDVLQTGTPGAVPIHPGTTLSAQIDGLEPLLCRIAAAKS